VFVDKELHNLATKVVAHVDDVEGDFQVGGDAARVSHLVRRTTAVSWRVRAAPWLAPQAHHHADDFVAGFDEQGGSD
jgi:hypothetical protein